MPDWFSAQRRPKPRKWGYGSDDGPTVDRSYDQSTEFSGDPVGMRVQHSSWGRGVIESTRGRGPNAVVTVRFETGERKTIVARYLTAL